MTLNEFLKLEAPEEYDLKLDYAAGQLADIADPIERFLVYKASGQRRSFYLRGEKLSEQLREKYPDLDGFDCDGCGLARQVYKTLWKDVAAAATESRISGERGDTMTSFQTPLNMAVAVLDGEQPFAVERQGAYSQNYCTALYADGAEELLARLNAIPGLRDFAAAVHTIGNFIPVPAGFNTARAGWPERDGDLSNWHDYWDLTLMKIWEYYALGGGPESLVRLLHGDPAYPDGTRGLDNCERWLTYFWSWDEFVERNYLQDFVDEYGTPIPFCKGHSWMKPVPADLGEFFATATELILKRGRRMAEALREAQ